MVGGCAFRAQELRGNNNGAAKLLRALPTFSLRPGHYSMVLRRSSKPRHSGSDRPARA